MSTPSRSSNIFEAAWTESRTAVPHSRHSSVSINPGRIQYPFSLSDRTAFRRECSVSLEYRRGRCLSGDGAEAISCEDRATVARSKRSSSPATEWEEDSHGHVESWARIFFLRVAIHRRTVAEPLSFVSVLLHKTVASDPKRCRSSASPFVSSLLLLLLV